MMDEQPRFIPGDYEILRENGATVSIRRSDGASIPTDPRNRDYAEFLRVTEAAEVAVVDITPAPPTGPTLEEKVAALEKQLRSVTTEGSFEEVQEFKDIKEGAAK